MGDIDPQLVGRIEFAWRDEGSPERESLIHGIVRYVSKLGVLTISDIELRAMRTFFTPEDAVELYKRIRDDSMRFEGEWREQFIEYFPESRDVLPKQQMTEEQYDEWLRENEADA